MKLAQLVTLLEATVVYQPANWEKIEVKSVFASDLMSDVLMSDVLMTHREHMIIITSLPTEQAVRAASIVSAEALVLVNNKVVTPSMIKLAKEQGITLICSPLTKFDACVRIGRKLEE